MQRLFWFILFVGIFAKCAFAAEPPLFSPIWHWKTIESTHFVMHYPEGHLKLAEEALSIAEEVHNALEPIIDWTPESKVDLVLMDAGDDANGFAQVYPYNRVILFSSPPESRSQLNDYDDWLRVLIAHEYTHILHLDKKSGLPAIINLVFGKLVNPNLANPHWLSEGFAVYFESHQSGGGRLRSSLFDMYLRADVLEDNFLTLDQISGTVIRWPQATTWYLYGSYFTQYLADRFGERIFSAISYLYGRRIVPYGLNIVMKEVSNYDYPTLYNEWKEFLRDRYQRQKQLIERFPLTDGVRLLNFSGNFDYLRTSQEGKWVYFFLTESEKRPGIYRLNLQNRTLELLTPTDSCAGFDLSADGQELIISLPVRVRSRFVWHDLFSLKVGSEELVRITQNERATVPAISPDGRTIAYVRYRFGKTELVLLDRKLNKTKVIANNLNLDQFFDPRFSPSGRFLVFSAHSRGASRDLFITDVITGKTERITNDASIELSPTFSQDGRFIYFSSDKTGVYNIYRYDLRNGTLERFTNVLTGAFAPAVLPDNSILFVGYSSQGYDLRRFVPPPHFKPIAAAQSDFRVRIIKETQTVHHSKPRNYSPFPSVYPHVWMPTAGMDHAGVMLGVKLDGADATLEHIWALEVDYGIESKEISFAGSYNNFSFPFDFSFSFSHSSQTLKDAVKIGEKKKDFNESFYNVNLGVAYAFDSKARRRPFVGYSHRIGLAYNISHTRPLSYFEPDPASEKPELPETGLNAGLSVFWAYGDSNYEPRAIGTAYGKGVSASLSLRHQYLGSRYNSITAQFGAAYYVRIPYTKTHSIGARLFAGLATGDYSYRRYFYLGGPHEISLVSNLLYNKRELGVFLRGYPPYSINGNRFVLLKSEYRFEVAPVERGISTYPLFLQRIHGAVFFDAANAWTTAFDITNTVRGVGAELRFDIIVGYFVYSTIRIGYAVGLDANGTSTVFVLLDNLL